jgi:hypothetical protein
MSTGDQSQYVRAKLAERGSNAQAKFMMDGFDRWAESTAPAREGQMEKMPAESQMASYGGAMTISKAKQKLLKLEGMHELEGGIDIIPQAVKDAANEAKKMIQVWRGVSARIDSFLEELQDQVIDDPKSSASLVNFAKTLQGWFNQIKFLKDILDGAAKLAESLGAGKKRTHSVKLRGGASLSWSDLAGYAKQITSLYMWLKTNAGNMKKILAMKSLQPEGQQILNVVNPILSAIGMGHPSGGRSASACCECDDMKGGFNPVGDMMGLIGNPVERPMGVARLAVRGMDLRRDGSMMPGATHGGRKRSARKVAIMEGPSYGSAAPVSRGMTVYGEDSGKKMAMHEMEMKKLAMHEPDLYRKMMGSTAPVSRGMTVYDDGKQFINDGKSAKPMYDDGKHFINDGKSMGGASCGGRAPSARGAIVKKVMREMGLSLPQASKYVKDKGLY